MLESGYHWRTGTEFHSVIPPWATTTKDPLYDNYAHGEPGRVRMPIKSVDEIVEMLMEPIISDIPYKPGDELLMFVNGMGGTPLIELYIIYRKAHEIASKHGLKVVRNLVGPYITSLEMAGTSITLLKLDDDMKKLWDAPVKTPALRWGV